MKAAAFLSDWLTHFLKSRDAIFHTLESIGSHDSYDLYVKHKTKEQFAVCRQGLEEAMPSLSADKDIIVACFNTTTNFSFLIAHWKELCAFPKLTLYFVNPQSSLEHKWVINPWVHNRVSDPASLKLGLKTMFETVEPLSERGIQALLADAPSGGVQKPSK